MHIHYFVLSKLASQLSSEWKGMVLLEAFSQNKDELVLGFGKPGREAWLRISCNPGFHFILPQDEYAKARKNVTTLFSDLLDSRLEAVSAVPYDRVLVLEFEGAARLFLKMHGSQSNVILQREGKVVEVFRKSLEADLDFKPIPGSFEPPKENLAHGTDFEGLKSKLREVSGVLDRHFAGAVWERMSNGQDYVAALDEVLKAARDDHYFISRSKGKVRFRLFETGEPGLVEIQGLIPALHLFVRTGFQLNALNRNWQTAQQKLKAPLKKLEGTLKSHRKNLHNLDHSRDPEEIGNILMANLHQLEGGLKTVELFDFYHNENLKIKLDPRLNPVQNAEKYFQKQKKRKAQRKHLEKLIRETEAARNIALKKLEALETHIAPDEITLTADGLDNEKVKALRDFFRELQINKAGSGKESQKRVPYNLYGFQGWEILVGRDARGNDELTMQHANRDDLWLHARGVTGSHVVIRNPSRKEIPKPVIEFAAGLAARFSKSKHESLVPVIYAPRKYVRKPKGANPGAVLVEKEEVVLVEPAVLN